MLIRLRPYRALNEIASRFNSDGIVRTHRKYTKTYYTRMLQVVRFDVRAAHRVHIVVDLCQRTKFIVLISMQCEQRAGRHIRYANTAQPSAPSS